MAKKGRRVRNAASKARANKAAAAETPADVTHSASKSRSRASTSKARPSLSKARAAASAQPKLSSEEQFRLEYAYVLKDLRWVFILAGIMFAILIALNLLLQA